MKFYKCKHCGSISTFLHDADQTAEYCGEDDDVIELVANTTDAAVEKHIPVVTVKGNNYHVEVGSVIHPMTAEHLIEFIVLETKTGYQFKKLTKDDQPIADFYTDEEVVAVYEYCNLHGLWKKEL